MYIAKENKKIMYRWNNIHSSKEIDMSWFNKGIVDNIVKKIHDEERYYHLSSIDNGIFQSAVKYFSGIGSHRCNLPLTTLMISSPGEVYAWQSIDYTTDTLPVEIPSWFWSNKRIFLSESSQFYLEINLLIKKLHSVYSIYNSFRKEKSDATHLSEFQHIEYEGKINLSKCKDVFMWLFESIFNHLYTNNKENLLYFITDEILLQKKEYVDNKPITIDFKDALHLLYEDTNDKRYKKFSMEYFWSREEVRLTQLLWWNVIVEKFPMLQIPFYHAIAEEEYEWVPLAKNADFILAGYRETIWAWERIRDRKILIEKAKIFNLPEEDYLPYTQSRELENYTTTSWFGLWWQRLVHRLTEQPTIYESTIIPRTHLSPNP